MVIACWSRGTTHERRTRLTSSAGRVGVAGAAVVGVAFGMARYVYGLTLPGIREDLELSELALGLIASATFAGYLSGLVFAGPLAARRGSRAPTTVGGVCGVLGAVIVLFAHSPWILALGAVLAGSAGGWVWAPYSDIVTRTVAWRHQSRALAMITSGTGGGLVVLGGLAVFAVGGNWRLIWAGVGVAAVAAAILNVALVPRIDPPAPARGSGGVIALARVLAMPAGYSVVYFAVVIVYFTYASDVLSAAAFPAFSVPLLYALVGGSGLVALATGAMVTRIGSVGVAAACLGTVGLALVLLGLQGDSLTATLVSACVFGAGYMTGSAVLAVWTAELVPDRAGAAFTSCLVVGALSSVAAPALAGAVIPTAGLARILVASAALSLLAGAVLSLCGRRSRQY